MNMQTELIALNMTKQEAMECMRACLMMSLVEDETRVQQGYEPMDFPVLAQRLASLLGINEAQIDSVANSLSEDLWSYAWYVYTNEWAWFKAERQARIELGLKEEDKNPELRKKAEKLYKKNFEAYTAEIDMKPKTEKTKDANPRPSNHQGPVV